MMSRNSLIQLIPPQAWRRPFNTPTIGYSIPQESETHNLFSGGKLNGVPIGGFGAGTINRGVLGDFSRWGLSIGGIQVFSDPTNNFAVFQKVEDNIPRARVLSASLPVRKSRSGWEALNSPINGSYYALFPKAWYHYKPSEEYPVEMFCEQFSPIFPLNYRELSYPVGIFNWHMQNTSNKRVEVSLMFSWKNMVGWFDDINSTQKPKFHSSRNFNREVHQRIAGNNEISGIVFDRKRLGKVLSASDGQFAIAVLKNENFTFSRRTTFKTNDESPLLWEQFAKSGILEDSQQNIIARHDDEIAGAIAVKCILGPGQALSVPFVLAWDLPIVTFGHGRRQYRYYTKFFGKEGNNVFDIATTALKNYTEWSRKINTWHESILKDKSMPHWYYSFLFNETYQMVDGMTMWIAGEVDGDPQVEKFGYIECPDYPFYCTMDLWFFASFALARYWPELEKKVIRRYAEDVLNEDKNPLYIRWQKRIAKTAKSRGAVAHDLGHKYDDPWNLTQSYGWQNANTWKDLNSQFVLLVYRDYLLTGEKDKKFLLDCWPAVKEAMEYIAKFDTDGDGLIENDGTPDQTFDVVEMKGVSSYCGGLWLASLKAAAVMAGILGHLESEKRYDTLYLKGQPKFEELLWTGEYFKVDTSGPYSDCIFIGQLIGSWFARLCNLGDIIDPSKVRLALGKIYQANFNNFREGTLGTLSMTDAHGKPLMGKTQCGEIMTGMNMALASNMFQYEMRKEGLEILCVLYRQIYEKLGLFFRTPAAYDDKGGCRAVINMRPLAIWSCELSK